MIYKEEKVDKFWREEGRKVLPRMDEADRERGIEREKEREGVREEGREGRKEAGNEESEGRRRK